MASENADRSVQLPVGEETLTVKIPHHAVEIQDWNLEQPFDPASVFDVLESPIAYPPLSEAFVAGDRIAITVEPGFPEVETIVTEVVAYLLKHAAEASQINILLAGSHAWLKDRLEHSLKERFESAFEVQCHNEFDQDSMGYLAADLHADPIYVNRHLLDADLVLPITCSRDSHAWAYAGLYGIVPWFTDAKTQQRWRQEAAKEKPVKSDKRQKVAKEVAWLLGIQPTLAVVPGPRASIDSLYFGTVEHVEKAIENALVSKTIHEPNKLADLLVATIDGDRDQQSWDNVARILYFAERFLLPDGGIAVVTDLDQPPGSVFRWLASAEERETAERHLLKSTHPNALAAVEILRSQTRHKIYLMSKLPAEQVEEWGMTAIGSPHELEHLMQTHASTVIIGGAQHRRLAKT